jgi:long-subunit acyl-CoA synthetase (AMP-forming)
VEKLENTYKKAPIVEQVWVYGNSFKSSLIAVVVPKEDALKVGHGHGCWGRGGARWAAPRVGARGQGASSRAW